MLLAVIGSGVAVCPDRNLILISPVDDPHGARSLRRQVIVARDVIAVRIHNLQVFTVASDVGFGSRQRALRRSVSDCRLMSVHQVAEAILGFTGMLISVELDIRRVLNLHGDLACCDDQAAVRRRDHVVRGHVFFAVHHLVAFIHRVVAGLCIGYVRYAARRARYQLVAFQQFAFGHRHCAVAMGCSVVCPVLACRTDRDRCFGVHHR